MQGNRMKEITLYRHERMLFALLRASLHERKTEITLFLDSTDEEWKQCHRLAVSQGVMALAWDGVNETTGGTATAPFRKAGMGSRCRKVREKISSLLQDGR
mgnify:CR=1 FL=1